LNLFLSLSFGQAFFPQQWLQNFPADVPQSIGVQMFLFSTIIGQLIMTFKSDFPTAMGL
jgi:SulP family sulfate permease